LNVIDTQSGELIGQVQFYPGGTRTGNPRARVLDANARDVLRVGSGFLSLVTLDGRALGSGAADCLLG
jgi:hypothetical protein